MKRRTPSERIDRFRRGTAEVLASEIVADFQSTAGRPGHFPVMGQCTSAEGSDARP
jgi:hypothetical protein